MDLKTKMELEKLICSFDKLKNRTNRYLNEVKQLYDYDDSNYISALILKEILSKPNSTAFQNFRIAENAEVEYQRLMQFSRVQYIPEESISFALETRDNALKIVEKEILDSLETHLGQKVVRLSNSQAGNLAENLVSYNSQAKKFLTSQGFTPNDINNKVATFEQAKESFYPDCTDKALEKETAYFDALTDCIMQSNVNGSTEPEVASGYASLIEHIAMNNVALDDIDSYTDKLRTFSQKRGYKAYNSLGDTSSTARASYYFNRFRHSLYGNSPEQNNANRIALFGYAEQKFGVNELKALAIATGKDGLGKK